MKYSGIEWLGMIPRDWGKLSLKFLSERIIVGIAEAATQAYRDKGVPIVRATNLKDDIIKIDDLLYLDEEFANKIKSKKIKKNDILTVRTGNAGISAVVPESLDGGHCFTMLITTVNRKGNPKYINYFLNCNNGKAYFDIEAWGTAQKNISVPILQNLLLPLCPLKEQQLIVDFLDQKTFEIDGIIKKIKFQTEKLKESKQSLISEAVTGKIEVLD
jgi:type I restriction enzyme S subunit